MYTGYMRYRTPVTAVRGKDMSLSGKDEPVRAWAFGFIYLLRVYAFTASHVLTLLRLLRFYASKRPEQAFTRYRNALYTVTHCLRVTPFT